MDCDVCGCDLKGDSNRANAGITISVLGANPARAKVEELFGKNVFRICHVCQLKSLGVKPKRHAEKPS